MVKDTNGYIKDLSNIPASPSQSEQRQRKMQKERLQDEFTTTLNLFQQVQRSTASKEKEQVNKAKAQAYGEPMLRKLLDCSIIIYGVVLLYILTFVSFLKFITISRQ